MATGRKQVAPRQTIASQWGNEVWDQSVQTFASKADRDTQFPTPHLGACCALDTHPGLLLQWDGNGWLTTYSAKVVSTTNAFGTAVHALPYPFTGGVPAFVVAAEGGAAPYDIVAYVNTSNTSAAQLAVNLTRVQNPAPIANVVVAWHYVASGYI